MRGGGIEKITVDGKDYLPITLPTANELAKQLAGKTFSSDSGDTITFIESWGSLGIQIGADEDSQYFADEEGTKEGNEYTYVFGYSWDTNYTAKITLYPDGTVQKITIGDTEYLPA